MKWGTCMSTGARPEAGVNDMRYDDDAGNKNSYVYDIVDSRRSAHTLRLHMKAGKADDDEPQLFDRPPQLRQETRRRIAKFYMHRHPR